MLKEFLKVVFSIYGFTSYARNSQKKQYLIFGEISFSFAYLSAVWLLFGQKSNWNHCRQDFGTWFCQNCNETADK